jgi:predicted aspartyl protease
MPGLIRHSMVISFCRSQILYDTDAVLADGSTTRLRCYYCVVDWMNQATPVQVVENNGNLPLIGTGLLSGVDLRINYRTGICTIS